MVFNYSSRKKYARSLASFLKFKKSNAAIDISSESLKKLEGLVNKKAAVAEDRYSTFAQRLILARDYRGICNAEISRLVGVSREAVRLWVSKNRMPSRQALIKLSVALDVPLGWLEKADAEQLAANSPIGQRVGSESHSSREQLYSFTLRFISTLVFDALERNELMARVEAHVHADLMCKSVARKAGGRWHVGDSGELLFVPWQYTRKKMKCDARNHWSVEVEQIITEELQRNQSVYAAWGAVRKRCLEAGLTESQFPKRITLHKRVSECAKEIQLYGIDWNFEVENSVREFQGLFS